MRSLQGPHEDLTNMAWAFSTAGEPAPLLLDPMLVLDTLEAQGIKPDVMYS